jgi:heme-degrading monooxygenase HmoA
MHSRVARYKIPEEKIDEAIAAFEQAVEELRGISGSRGGYLLIDRENCTGLTVTFWEDRAALDASEVQASRLRSQAIGPLGGEITAVDRCEVALNFSELTTV